jgi:hypothetical protein
LTLTLKSAFWLLFSLGKKVARHQPAKQAGETAFDFDFDFAFDRSKPATRAAALNRDDGA